MYVSYISIKLKEKIKGKWIIFLSVDHKAIIVLEENRRKFHDLWIHEEFVNITPKAWTIRNYKGDFPGSPVVKTLPSNAGGVGSIPGWGAKMPHSSWPKKKKKYYCNKFNKDFKNGPHQ